MLHNKIHNTKSSFRKKGSLHFILKLQPVGEGTGLGLSVSYGIVQEHGGSISVESPTKDPETQELSTGTAFRVRFPAAREDKYKDREND